MALPLRGRLMVGRLTLDQVVKVRVLAPQPEKKPAQAGFFIAGVSSRETVSAGRKVEVASACTATTRSSRATRTRRRSCRRWRGLAVTRLEDLVTLAQRSILRNRQLDLVGAERVGALADEEHLLLLVRPGELGDAVVDLPSETALIDLRALDPALVLHCGDYRRFCFDLQAETVHSR